MYGNSSLRIGTHLFIKVMHHDVSLVIELIISYMVLVFILMYLKIS